MFSLRRGELTSSDSTTLFLSYKPKTLMYMYLYSDEKEKSESFLNISSFSGGICRDYSSLQCVNVHLNTLTMYQEPPVTGTDCAASNIVEEKLWNKENLIKSPKKKVETKEKIRNQSKCIKQDIMWH